MWELMKYSMFSDTLSASEPFFWRLLKSVITNFLGNKHSAECEKEVEEFLKKYLKLAARMQFKMHFLRFHLDHPRTVET